MYSCTVPLGDRFVRVDEHRGEVACDVVAADDLKCIEYCEITSVNYTLHQIINYRVQSNLLEDSCNIIFYKLYLM